MRRFLKTLRARLFFWYVGSLAVFSLFFYLVVHIFAFPYGTELFILLFILLGSAGFYIIYKITRAITYLSARIRQISRKNLDERITDITGEDEIGELASSFNALLDNIHESFQREQQFIADVAHELKTPLATLRSTLEVALSKERNKEEYRKAITESLEEVDSLSSTLKNVLDLAWSETHEEKKKSEKFNISSLMEELSDIAEKMALEKNIAVQTNIEKDLYVTGFRDKLARAVLNIIENAVKYTNQGKIAIKLFTSHNRAFITISDTGQGIKKDELSRIFNRFYRGSKTDKVFGSGLGLAISKSVITIHRGYINVKSAVGKGTTFTIILPLVSS